MSEPSPIWTPSIERQQNSRMAEFITRLAEQGLVFDDYAALHAWSINDRAAFWKALCTFTDIHFTQPADSVLVDGDKMSDGIISPTAQWFTGARLNFAENLLRYRDEQTALVFSNENTERRSLSYAELYREVAKVAAAMRAMDITQGDRVAALMPNCPETVITMLAAASIGAVFSSCSPDFGSQGILDRFGQIQPKLLVSANAYQYGGKTFDLRPQLETIHQSLSATGLEKLIIVPFVDTSPSEMTTANTESWQDFIVAFGDATEVDFEPLPFNHPLYILYSSGTTGVPKCIVHSAGGALLQHIKEHQLHLDIRREDVLFYYTTCGWMMWNWLVSGLATGTTLVLYDGSPTYPHNERLWDLAEKEGITHFGTSAKYISAMEKAGVKPKTSHKLALRTIMSTGSPLAHESYDYAYRDIADDLALLSISGGTDLIACFALGCPLLPVYRGQLQCPALGMATDVWLEDGTPAAPNQQGELVCAKAFPSMPIRFWNDDDGSKYHNAYFAKFPNVWAHGDHAEKTPQGGFIIHGRSDAVLNPGGVRIGTAEIYRQVECLPEVIEGLAIAQQWDNDVRIVLFVVLAEGIHLDDVLTQKIRQQIRDNCTPRHVPAKVIAVPELPRTISGKIVELAVRNIVHGLPVKNTDALKNPDALKHFADLDALKE